MKIESIHAIIDGYVDCKSRFYQAQNVCGMNLTFRSGVNRLVGEIDSGIWGVSYALSMFKHAPEDFVMDVAEIVIDGQKTDLSAVSDRSCYLDKIHPMFSSQNTVRNLVSSGLKKSCATETVEDIRNLFCLDKQRFERPLSENGNEVYRAMGAIGCSYGKQVFCLPWLSKKRFESLHMNMTCLLDVLESLGKIVIVPIGG